MASVYTNDLRLEEIGSGEQSGTWGDTTNTNLELIAEGLSYGTEGITTNANTHTSTVADGATDPARSMYIEYTGTLDSACTITIAPNTLSRMHFIENGTSGSQNIIIKQGSGATITIPPGDTKAVYLDGAGSGAAVVDAFASLSVVDLKVQDDLTVTDDLIVGGDIDLEGSIDVNGTANLDVTNIVGDLTVTGDTITFTSANGSDPALKLINTTNDTDGAELQIRKDKGAAGADGDIVGLISFIGDDAAQQQHIFAKMAASIVTAADGSEGGKLAFGVASHDAEFQNGLVLQDGNAEDEVDVTIGNGAASVTTIAGKVLTATGGAGLPSHSFSGDPNTGMFSAAADAIGFSAGGTQRLIVESNGHILHQAAATTVISHENTSSNNVYIKFKNTNNDRGFIGYETKELAFYTFSGGNAVRNMRIFENRNVSVEAGNLVIGTAGKGIDFSATSDGSGTDNSSVFSDYEEGTWSPAINVGTINPSKSRYTKIGNTVHLRCNLADISDSSTSTDITITGLPYAPISTNVASGSCMFRYFNKSNATQMNPYIGGASTVTFYWSNLGNLTWTPVEFVDGQQNNMDIIFTITYETG